MTKCQTLLYAERSLESFFRFYLLLRDSKVNWMWMRWKEKLNLLWCIVAETTTEAAVLIGNDQKNPFQWACGFILFYLLRPTLFHFIHNKYIYWIGYWYWAIVCVPRIQFKSFSLLWTSIAGCDDRLLNATILWQFDKQINRIFFASNLVSKEFHRLLFAKMVNQIMMRKIHSFHHCSTVEAHCGGNSDSNFSSAPPVINLMLLYSTAADDYRWW